jgi:hypothetical protein
MNELMMAAEQRPKQKANNMLRTIKSTELKQPATKKLGMQGILKRLGDSKAPP